MKRYAMVCLVVAGLMLAGLLLWQPWRETTAPASSAPAPPGPHTAAPAGGAPAVAPRINRPVTPGLPSGPDAAGAVAGPGAAGPGPGPAGPDRSPAGAPAGPEAADTATNSRPAAPPGWDEPPPPPSLHAQVKRTLAELQRSAGPETAARAAEMLQATNPVIRAVGASLLGQIDGLNEEMIRAVANDEDLTVPLMVLESLRDSGKTGYASSLGGALGARGVDGEAVAELLRSGALGFGGGRAALDLSENLLTTEQARDLYADVATDDLQDYAVRMKAAVDLRDLMAFTEYRDTIDEMKALAAGGDDALWAEGIGRLSAELAGPVEVHSAVPTLTRYVVDEMLAIEYPGMLEDLALKVENVLDHDASQVAAGTAARLRERVDALKQRPWMEEQQTALQRLEHAIDGLGALEQDRPYQPPAGSIPPIAQ